MKSRDYRDYLQDILDAVNDIESFVDGMTYEEFIKDRKTLNAAVNILKRSTAGHAESEACKVTPKGVTVKQEAHILSRVGACHIDNYNIADDFLHKKRTDGDLTELKFTIHKYS